MRGLTRNPKQSFSDVLAVRLTCPLYQTRIVHFLPMIMTFLLRQLKIIEHMPYTMSDS